MALHNIEVLSSILNIEFYLSFWSETVAVRGINARSIENLWQVFNETIVFTKEPIAMSEGNKTESILHQDQHLAGRGGSSFFKTKIFSQFRIV